MIFCYFFDSLIIGIKRKTLLVVGGKGSERMIKPHFISIQDICMFFISISSFIYAFFISVSLFLKRFVIILHVFGLMSFDDIAKYLLFLFTSEYTIFY